MSTKIISIVGSLHHDSLNKRLLMAFIERAPKEVVVEEVSIDMPLYSQEGEAQMPSTVTAVKQAIESADGVLIVTPEYNRSIPGSLKNMIDWMSRPYGKNSFKGKVVGVAGATGGLLGTALAQYHLKQILVYLDATLFGQPEFMLSNAMSKFDEEGKLIDAATEKQIDLFWATFITTLAAQQKKTS